MADPAKPQKRHDRLIEVDLGDEVLLYDERTHHAHTLNQTAATVWRGLDGRTPTRDIAASLEPKLTSAQRQRLVSLTLDDLATRDLLDRPRPAARPKGVTRRQILRGLAAAGAIAPVIASIEIAHAGPGVVSAFGCTTPGCDSLCPGTVCCACVHTTENTNVCVTPLCTGQPCTASSQCPPGWVCFTSGCCALADGLGGGAGGGAPVFSQCVPLCTSVSAPCPGGRGSAQTQGKKRSWMAR